jgi:hypothetical protein
MSAAMKSLRAIGKPPPKIAPPNYAAVLAAFGQEIFGSTWAGGIARLTGASPRTLTRIAAAVKAGEDYPAARAVLAALHDKLGPIVADLKPWSRHAAEA